jgi:thiol-disulfide isomerase/thioredoxin
MIPFNNGQINILYTCTILMLICCAAENMLAAEGPSLELALNFKPVHEGIEYDIPTKQDYEKCKFDIERGAINGYVVIGPQGLAIRRFVDMNGDNLVDQWRYYQNGMEVYRDIDSNFNKKVDQSRWLNTAGTRWAIDENEDGKTDRWQMISAEEVSREAVKALASRDLARLQLVFLDNRDIQTLKLNPEFQQAVQKEMETLAGRISQFEKKLVPDTKWVRFDSSMLMPNLIPKDDGKAQKDLVVYENVMAIIDQNGKTGFIQLGEIVKVDDCWKLIQAPKFAEGDTLQMGEGGLLMQPAVAAMPVAGGNQQLEPEIQRLIDQLQGLDKENLQPGVAPQQVAVYYRKRMQIIQSLVNAVSAPAEKKIWQQQLVDGIAAAIQTGSYPEGTAQLAAMERTMGKDDPKSSLVPYITYRRLLAEYSSRLQDPQATAEKRQQVQDWWLIQLNDFAERYGNEPDAADAMLQLGMTLEFLGKNTDANRWYQQLVKMHPTSNQAQKGKGALKRLALTGQTLELNGSKYGSTGTWDIKSYKGRVTLVVFWSTWCQPHTDELPQLLKLYADFRAKGYEVLGVNLDTDESAIKPYLAQNRVPWNQIHEQGGLESRLAQEFGIFSLPTMFLLDKEGKVISRGTSVDELKDQLPKLLDK